MYNRNELQITDVTTEKDLGVKQMKCLAFIERAPMNAIKRLC